MDDPEIPLRIYIEQIINLRHDQYKEKFTAMEAKFGAMEKSTDRTLAALHEAKVNTQWSVGAMISIAISLVATVIALWGKKF